MKTSKKLLSGLVMAAMTTPVWAQTSLTLPTDSADVDSLFMGNDYELGEVTVTAQRKLVKMDIDKTTYDVEHDEEAKTKNVLEILRKVPMVSVDAQENVKIKGSSSYKVYRNGHPDPSFQGSTLKDILKAIPANTIKKIEVITDPGAKEDAEGTQYILNIVMQSNARFGGVMAQLYTNVNALKGETGEGAYVSAQLGKLVLSLNYGYQLSKQDQAGESETVYKTNGQRMTDSYASDAKINVHYGNINASYDIDSLNLATVSFGGYYYNVGLNGQAWAKAGAYDASGTLLYKYDNLFDYPKYHYYSFNGRFDYQHKTHLDGEVLTASYMMSTTRSVQSQTSVYQNMVNMPVSYNGIQNYNTEKFLEQTAQVDYVRPFGKAFKWEIGAKYINRSNKSDVVRQYDGAEDMNQHTKFDHLTQVFAAYTEGILSLGKMSARAGVRYEYTYINAKYPFKSDDNFKKHLSDLVPSASLRYAFDDINSLKFSFSTNINRPGISYLNPAVTENVSSISYGNPDLNSSRNYQFSLDYAYVTTNFTFECGPFFNMCNNSITSYSFLKDNKQVSTYCDYMRYKAFGAWAWAQVKPWKGGQLSVNLSGTKIIFRDLPAQLSLGKWQGWASFDFSQDLFWKLKLGADAGTTLGHSVGSPLFVGGKSYYYMMSLQRSFLKDDRLTIGLSAMNVIGPHGRPTTSYTVQGDYTGYNRSTYYAKSLRITASIRLGRIKASVKQVDKSIDNNDVVGGLYNSANKK